MDDATPETWKPIPGYEGLYEVSDLGRIRSLLRKGGNNRMYGGRILKPLLRPPYLTVTLSRDGLEVRCRIHQLVALAFIGPPGAEQEVRHGPGGALDNRLVNLCYGTHAENQRDKIRDGTMVLAGLAAVNAAKTHCDSGHEFTEDNTYLYRGTRCCRTCRRSVGITRREQVNERRRQRRSDPEYRDRENQRKRERRKQRTVPPAPS